MYLSENDSKKLEKRLKNPEFKKLYHELMSLRGDQIISGFPLNGSSPDGLLTPHEIENGYTLRLVICYRCKLPHHKIIEHQIAMETYQAAENLAVKLAWFFPLNERWRWVTIFEVMAINPDAARIEQRQKGGRTDSLTEDEINERLCILADIENTKKKLGITYDQTCTRLSPKYNQHLIWSTVRKWRKYRT